MDIQVDLMPNKSETLEQYKFRLMEIKEEKKLSWKNISELIFKYFNKQLSKDFIRHEYYGLRKMEEVKQIENDEYTKCLILNDIHLPFNRDDILTEIENNKDVDYIIIGGDLLDCVSCSFWSNWEHPNVEEELILAHEFINKINNIINPEKTKIIAIRGNHEYRYTRSILNMQEKQLQKLLNPNLLSMLEKGFTFYEKDKDITYKPINNFQYIDDWQTKLFGNLIVAHPTDFSSIDGKMCEKVSEYFLNEGIAEKDDVIVFGHTHKQSSMKVNRRAGLFVIENGCLCKEQEYAKTGKLKFTPQNYGYTYLKFKEGQKINLNDIKIVYLN